MKKIFACAVSRDDSADLESKSANVPMWHPNGLKSKIILGNDRRREACAMLACACCNTALQERLYRCQALCSLSLWKMPKLLADNCRAHLLWGVRLSRTKKWHDGITTHAFCQSCLSLHQSNCQICQQKIRAADARMARG